MSLIIRLLTALLLFALVATRASSQEPVQPLDRIVAVVNNEVVLASELQLELRSMRAQLRDSNIRAPAEDVLEKQVLERVIMTRLQVQAAAQSGVRLNDTQLNAALEDIAGQNKMTLAEFRSTLEAEGYGFAAFRERIRGEILIQQVRQRMVQSRVTVPEREISRYLENQKLQQGTSEAFLLAQILFETPEGASVEQIDQARKRGEEVLSQLQAGEDFGELAVAYSDGRNALDGGKLGWREQDELPQLFADALETLAKGEISALLRSSNGFHIIKLIEQRTGERLVIQQTHARHILVLTGELADESEVVKRLETLRERIVNGEDFGALARSNSDDRGSALREGDLGWVNPGDTVPAFERQMDLLDDNEISQPFRSQFGWHIVQVLERRDFDSTDAVRRTKAREVIAKRKQEEELQGWMRQLRDEAYVEIRLDEQ